MAEHSFASVWGLSYSDFEFLRRFGVKSQVMIGCQLLYLRKHGKFPFGRSDLDLDVIDYVSDQIGVADDCDVSFSSDTARRQRGFILEYMGLCRASRRDRIELQAWMVKHLGGCDLKLSDWVASGYSQALRVGVFIPSDKIMERLARAARREFREIFLNRVASRLSAGTIVRLEWMLSEPLAATGFQRLKDDVGAATLDNVLSAAQKVSFVEGLCLPIDLLDHLDRGWITQLSRQVEGETAFEMRRHALKRRLGLLAIYLMHRQSQLIDGLVDLLLEIVHRISTRSKRKVISKIAADVEKVYGKERLLVDIATAAVDHPEGRIEDVIFPIVGAEKLRAVIKEHRAKGTLDTRIQTVMRSSYSNHYRRMLPPLLNALDFRSNNATWHPILTALGLIVRFAQAGRRVILERDIPPGIIPNKWRDAVIDQHGRVNVISFELCVLIQLRERIRAKEIWIEGADRHRNPDDDLLGDFAERRDVYYADLGLSQQYVKGLAHHNVEDAENLARLLRQIKGCLWNGNLHDSQAVIEDLVLDLEELDTDYASIKALRKAATEFETYITNNKDMIPNYAERRRYGERVSTGFVESTVNTVVGKRFGKKQQMRWSKQGLISCFRLVPARSTGHSAPSSSSGIRE